MRYVSAILVLLARSEHKIEWGKWEDNIGGIQGLNSVRTGLGELWTRGGADFALAYDFLYDYMTKQQQDRNKKPIMGTRLTGSVKSVEPHFKVMFVPFLVGEPLPESRLEKNRLTVGWDDQEDVIAFDVTDGKLGGLTVQQTLKPRSTPRLKEPAR